MPLSNFIPGVEGVFLFPYPSCAHSRYVPFAILYQYRWFFAVPNARIEVLCCTLFTHLYKQKCMDRWPPRETSA